jgi:hypothetical protein
MRSSHVLAIGLLWLTAAVVLGAAGIVARLQPPGPQLVLGGLTVALVAAGAYLRPFRRWLRTVDLRIPVALHLTRFVGANFLVLYQRGELPYAFAVPGGIGDIIVATIALGLLLFVSPSGPRGRTLYLGWNFLGLLDILGVVATAATLAIKDPSSMQALTKLPLSLLPTFLVPIIIASHILLFVRLLGRNEPAVQPSPERTC